MREGTITFRLAFIEWEFQEACVITGTKRSRGRAQMQEIRKIIRNGVADGVETDAGNFVRNARFDG